MAFFPGYRSVTVSSSPKRSKHVLRTIMLFYCTRRVPSLSELYGFWRSEERVFLLSLFCCYCYFSLSLCLSLYLCITTHCLLCDAYVWHTILLLLISSMIIMIWKSFAVGTLAGDKDRGFREIWRLGCCAWSPSAYRLKLINKNTFSYDRLRTLSSTKSSKSVILLDE
jgi:hypothetical protein